MRCSSARPVAIASSKSPSSSRSSTRSSRCDCFADPGEGRREVDQSLEPRDQYSPRLRTALVLVGAGTAGAYHAGVLKAFHEAGVKVDVVAGRGMGAVSAAYEAIDGASRLWEPGGLWRDAAVGRT